jgi:hypothetical protein
MLILNLGLEYSTTGYRLKHLVDNTRARIWVNIRDARFAGLPFQETLNTYLKNCDINNDFTNLDIKNASFEFQESGYNSYVRNIYLYSDKIRIDNGRGYYTYYKGYNANLYSSIKDVDKESGLVKTKQVPLKLKGDLLNPVIKKRNTQTQNELVLF